MEEGIKFSGIFKLTVKKKGVVIEEVEEKNLIVTLGRTTLAKLLANPEVTDAIATISVGSNGTSPALGDTAITNPLNKPIDGYSYPSSGQVQFNWTIFESEAIGSVIAEYGLFSSNGIMFNRIARQPFTKTSDIELTGRWIINFNN